MEHSSKIQRIKNLMQVLSLNEAIDQLALKNSVCCCWQLIRSKDGHVLRSVL